MKRDKSNPLKECLCLGDTLIDVECIADVKHFMFVPTVTSPHHIQMVKARSEPSREITLIPVPRLQNPRKEKIQQKNSPLGCRDGTFYARQVEVCDSSDVEHV